MDDNATAEDDNSSCRSGSSDGREDVNNHTHKDLDKLLGEIDTPRQLWLRDLVRVTQPLPVRALACGGAGALMLLETGEVYTWSGSSQGSASAGRILTQQASHTSMRQVPNALVRVEFGGGKDQISIDSIAAGDDHFAALSLAFSNNLYTWGGNALGQLGLGDTQYRPNPTVVSAIDERVIEVQCGRQFTIAQTELGVVYAWGANNKGQLGQLVRGEEVMENEYSKRATQQAEASQRAAGGTTIGTADTNFDGATPAQAAYDGPVPAMVSTQLAMSSKPLKVEALSLEKRRAAADRAGDDSRAYQTLHLDAQGDQAAAFTSVWGPTRAFNYTNRDELLRLRHLASEKRARIADVDLRLQHVIAHWANARKGRIRPFEFPSACSTAAEQIDIYSHQREAEQLKKLRAEQETETNVSSGQRQTSARRTSGLFARRSSLLRGQSTEPRRSFSPNIGHFEEGETVIRDPALASLDDRTALAAKSLEEERASLEALGQDRSVTLSALNDVDQELSDVKASSTTLREKLVRIRQEFAATTQKLEGKSRIGNSLAGEEVDQFEWKSLKEKHTRLLAEQISFEQALQDLGTSRKVLEERFVELRQRVSWIDNEYTKVELRIHMIDMRIFLYQRLRLKRQQRLQNEHSVNIKRLWETTICAVHELWKEHILPADVFSLLEEMRADPSSDELSLRELVSQAVTESERRLEVAAEAATTAVEQLAQQFRRLEVRRPFQSLSGPPALPGAKATSGAGSLRTELSAVTLAAPVLTCQAGGRHGEGACTVNLVPNLGRIGTKQGVATGSKVTDRTFHSLLLLTKIHFSAVVGEEVAVGSVSFLLDGKGNREQGASNSNQRAVPDFGSQELCAVLYEHDGTGPTTMLRDAVSNTVRVSAGADAFVAEFTFSMPVTVTAAALARGFAGCWVGLFVEKPCGFVRVFGAANLAFGSTTADLDLQAGQRAPSSVSVLLSSLDAYTPAPPAAIDLLADQVKKRCMVNLFASAKILTVCDRCAKILSDTVTERRRINAMLLSVSAVRGIERFAREVRTGASSPCLF